MDKKEIHKEKEDISAIDLSDEEPEEFAEEGKPVQEIQEKERGKVLKEQELEKQTVCKVEREAVSRVKEKPD